MSELLIATTNPAKLAEYRRLMSRFGLRLLSLEEAGIAAEAPESGATFMDNARMKAGFYFAHSGLPTLADDGGLEVDALAGAPGVCSHRWLGEYADDQQLAEEVVRRMAAVPPPRRTARIRAAAVLLWREPGVIREALAEAALEGMIGERCCLPVRPGFPYRSVLFLPERGRYLAELDEEAAARLSQRSILVVRLTTELERLAALG